jgi:hypothetical protein
MDIGRLNESPLHQALKDRYTVEHAVQEAVIGGFVADVVHPDQVIYEIQTAGFRRLRRKLSALLETHRVVLVHPVVAVRHIYRMIDATDVELRSRRSPKRGVIADVLRELVSLPDLLCHPNFELEVLLVELAEWRQFTQRRRGGSGWQVVGRRLLEVVAQQRFRSPQDLLRLITAPLAEPFSTAELAQAMPASRELAQKLAFCLRACGLIEPLGKKRNAILYGYRTG